MHQFNFLAQLLSFEPQGSPFISIFLDTAPNGTGKKDFDIFLNKQLKEHEFPFEVNSPEWESYQEDVRRINEFVEGLEPSTRGAAIFASSGAGGLFKTFEFGVPFEENQFIVSDRPRLYPLVRLVAQHPAFAVVSADTNAANIFIFKRGQILQTEEIQNTKTNRTEVGGWSQMRYQRHVDNFHQQHAKEVVEELGKLVRGSRIERIVLVGDEAVIIPILRGELTQELNEKVVGVLALNIDTPEHELLEAADKMIQEFDAAEDKERIERLLEQNYDGGIAVSGVENTIAALLNGQVQELYLTASADEINYSMNQVENVVSDYEPVIESDLPDLSDREALLDQLIKLAADSADNIRFIEDPHLLKSLGGVGALLRYQVKGVSNL